MREREPMFDRIVAVVGMPRSGTSWVGQILDSSPDVAYRLDPIFSYAFKNAVGEGTSPAQYRRFFEDVYRSNDPFLLQTERRERGAYPTFRKSPSPRALVWKTTRFHHLLETLLERCPTLRIASIVRHPCGAIHSWLTTPNEFPSGADPMQEWRSGRCRKTAPEEFWGFSDWVRVTEQHMKLEAGHAHRFRIFRYEELVARPVEQARELYDFAGLVLEDQTREFLRACHERHDEDSYSVFKSPATATRWRDELDPSIRDAILRELRGTPLQRFLGPDA